MAAPTLFESLPAGFVYRPEFITLEEESTLLDRLRAMEFSSVVMHGVTARRRVRQFGWRYTFDDRKLTEGTEMPAFLFPLRDRAAAVVRVAADDLSEALVTEYPEGATIGWHRDAPMFGMVVGISLLSPCTFRLRRGPGTLQKPLSIQLEPRSLYVLDGEVRRDWQHSIPPTKGVRYSITFRTLRRKKPS